MEDQSESASGLGSCRATTIGFILHPPASISFAVLIGGLLVAAGRVDTISLKRDGVVEWHASVQLVLLEA